MTEDSPLSSTVERALRLVELLLTHPEGLSPAELQSRLDISRSTLFLLLQTLKQAGYAAQAERRGRYRAGPRLDAWRASPFPAGQDLAEAFYRESGRQPWPETLALAFPSARGAAVLAQVEPARPVRSAFALGQAGDDLAAALAVLTPAPGAGVLADGYCLAADAEKIDLALPVCRDGVHPAAALLLSAPAFRRQPAAFVEEFLPGLRALAARLSYQIGAPFYTPFQRPAETLLQPAAPLGQEEMQQFLQGPWVARLACVRPDGLPHVIPVWQEWDGERFLVIAWQGSQWAEHVLRNPNVSLTVDEPWNPLRRVVARGLALSLRDGAGFSLAGLLERLAQRYLGNTAADLEGQVAQAFAITPHSLRGWKGLSV